MAKPPKRSRLRADRRAPGQQRAFAPSLLDPADGDSRLHAASVATNRFAAGGAVFDDHAAESSWNLRVAHEIAKAESRARPRGADDLLEQELDSARVEPLADVGDRERVDARVLARRQIFGVATVDELQRIHPGPQHFPMGALEIRRHTVLGAGRIRAAEHLV